MRLLFLFAAPVFACGVIDGDRIIGRDLAAISPAFAAIDAQIEISAAPLPGAQRVLRSDELVRLAKQNNIALEGLVSAVCFERATEILTVERLLPALRKAVGLEDARIEIVDFSHFGVPRGTLEFPKSSLMPNGLWRGRLLYDQSHSMPVWVKARITVDRTWVEAAEPLPTGKSILASQLIVKTGPRFPFDSTLIETIDELVGRRPVRTLTPGSPIIPAMLAIAHDVERGDLVAVEVKVGGAVLDFDATAESSGRAGDSILIKNPENGHSFLAKIQNKNHVLVER